VVIKKVFLITSIAATSTLALSAAQIGPVIDEASMFSSIQNAVNSPKKNAAFKLLDSFALTQNGANLAILATVRSNNVALLDYVVTPKIRYLCCYPMGVDARFYLPDEQAIHAAVALATQMKHGIIEYYLRKKFAIARPETPVVVEAIKPHRLSPIEIIVQQKRPPSRPASLYIEQEAGSSNDSLDTLTASGSSGPTLLLKKHSYVLDQSGREVWTPSTHKPTPNPASNAVIIDGIECFDLDAMHVITSDDHEYQNHVPTRFFGKSAKKYAW